MNPAAGVDAPTPYVVDAVYCGAPGPGDMARVRVLRLVVWVNNPDVLATMDKYAAQVAECRKWEYMVGVLGFAQMLADRWGVGLRVYGWREWGRRVGGGPGEWGWFEMRRDGDGRYTGEFTRLLREGLARDFFGPGVEYAPARELVEMAETWPRR